MDTVPHIRLFLDTAKVEDWETWLPTGLFYGVTTNPLLLERAGVACTMTVLEGLVNKALDLGMQEVQIQTWGGTVEALLERGQALAALDPSVVVKVPITQAGSTAAAKLVKADVRVTLTGIYAVHQVLIGAAIDADYVAPYLGRINDLGRDGQQMVAQMQQALNGVQSDTRILTASIRDVADISELAAAGVDTFTFSSAIATQFFTVPATLAAVADFERAAKVMGRT
ncbi:MAG: transaldolase family protein [Cyanobacteria bacterium J06632_22]